MTAERIGEDNLRRTVQATREPGRTIRKPMPWHQSLARFVVLCLMWAVALVWMILPPS